MLSLGTMQKNIIRSLARLSFVLTFVMPLHAGAWGSRGHQIVAETASALISSEPNAAFMKQQSFKMGIYANTPDFIWKRPETYSLERPQHYMDIEIFQREFAKHPEIKNPFELSRKEFEAKFPEIKPEAGRAFWRIREFEARLEDLSKQLRELAEPTGPARQKLQEKWIVTAGLMAHYIGDLSMPLHMSENHDGQLTGQKGVHSYFEDTITEELYPEISCEVDKEARKQWSAFTKKHKDKTVLELVQELGARSEKDIAPLLAIDKKSKRENIKKNLAAYHPMIRKHLVDSVLTLAELYRRNLGWTWDNNKFYYYGNAPEYVMPGEISDKPAPAK